MTLEARTPGTREFLRAAVDYDHIDGDDGIRFNLALQLCARRDRAHRSARDLPRGIVRSAGRALPENRARRIPDGSRSR